MKNQVISTAVTFASLALTLSWTTQAMAQETSSNQTISSDCPESVPASLVPAADQRLVFKRAATGVQIYACTANAAGATSWLFIAPQANLYKADKTLDGTHFVGPVWQDNQGSSVTAAKVSGESVDPNSVAWLLLKSKANSGPGQFEGITSIQRLNTVGGNAPDAATCTPATLGTIQSVPYTADYYFYDTHSVANEVNLQCR